MQVVARGLVALLAAAQVVLHARRELQRVRHRLAEIRLQVQLVAEIMVMVPRHAGALHVVDHRGVGRADEEAVAAVEAGVQRRVAIDVVLAHRQVAVRLPLAHAGQVVAGVGLEDGARGDFHLVLRLAGKLAVRARPGAAVREDRVVEPHVRQRCIEGKAAPAESLGAAHVPVHERGADAQLVGLGHVRGLHREHGRKGLAVLAAVAAEREAHALEEEGREAAALGLPLHVGAVRSQDVHPVDEGLALLALAAADVELAVLPYLLRAGQGLQGRDEVPAGVARHHHVQRIHFLELVALAHAERAGGHDHLVDRGGLLPQPDVQRAERGQVGSNIEVFIAQQYRTDRLLALLACYEGEVAFCVRDAAVERADDEDVHAHERALVVGDSTADGGLCKCAGRNQQRGKEKDQLRFHVAKMDTEKHSCNF